MKTKNLIVTFFLSLTMVLTGCMPDSFTKFKEEPPAKKNTSSSGGSSGGSGGSGGSGTTSTSVDGGYVPQSAGQEWLLRLKDTGNISSYSVGDKISASTTQIASSATQVGVAEVLNVDTTNAILKVQILSTGPGQLFEDGYYIDNCDDGAGIANDNDYGDTDAACSSSAANQIETTFRYFGDDHSIADQPIFLNGTTPYSGTGIPADWSLALKVFEIEYPGGASSEKSETGDLELPLGISFDSSDGTITIPQPPFKAPQLDVLELGIEVTNGAGETHTVIHRLGSIDLSSYTLAYDFENNSRIALSLLDAGGFTSGDVVYSCSSSVYSDCDTAAERNGEATIYFVNKKEGSSADDNANKVFVTVAAAGTNTFSKNGYLHKNGGGYSSKIAKRPQRLWNTTDTPTVTPTLNPTVAGVTYSVSPALTGGLSLNTGTGVITGSGAMTSREDEDYQISVVDSTTGETLATQDLKISVVDPPSSLTYNESHLKALIGDKIDKLTPSLVGLPTTNKLRLFSVSPALPSGLELDEDNGEITGSPNEYISGATYTISGFHPHSGTAAFDTYALQFSTATPIAELALLQNNGDSLILNVDDVSGFVAGESVSTPTGGQATITFIDSDKKQLYVDVSANLSGAAVFKKDDELDDVASFVVGQAVIESVVHVFSIGDDLTTGTGTPITTEVYTFSGSTVSLATGENLTFAISPDAPDSLTLNTTTGVLSDADAVVGMTVSEATTYTIAATNEIGSTITQDFKIAIIDTPSDIGVASMQFLPISGVSNTRFYKGTRISTSNGAEGKVIDLYEDSSDNKIKGILVQASQQIEPGEGIDNTPVYFAAEDFVLERNFIYVEDSTAFSVSDPIVTVDGNSGTVLDVYVDAAAATPAHRLYVEVDSGSTFENGQSIDDANTFASQETLITHRTKQNYVNFILNVADSSAFDIGSFISGQTNGGKGFVVFNDEANERLFVRILTGFFEEDENIDNSESYVASETTVTTLESPFLKVTVGAADADLEAGDQLTADNAGFQAAGELMFDEDESDSTLYVNAERGIFEKTDGLDDANPHSGTSEQTISAVANDHTFYLFVGDSVSLKTYVRGSFTSVSVNPDLPEGLTLNLSNASISGTPTEPSTKKTYTMTVRSGSTTLTHTFDMVVLNQFRILQETASASSFIFHKQGQGNNTRDCRVNSLQIGETNTDIDGVSDINCIFDGAENDLYNQGIKFKARVGGGLCEYVRFRPFSYETLPVRSTNATYYQFNITTGADLNSCLTNAGSITGDGFGSEWTNDAGSPRVTSTGQTINFGDIYCAAGTNCDNTVTSGATPGCDADYSLIDGSFSFPLSNCDTGSYTTITLDCEYADNDADPHACTCTRSESVTDCGGSIGACVGGAINDVVEDTSASNASITGSFSGLYGDSEAEWEIKSPQSLGKFSNTHIANFSNDNACISGTYEYDFDSWQNYSPTNSPYDPLGSGWQNTYVFECLDAADDIRARVRIAVRDWDKAFDSNDPIDEWNPVNMDDATATCFGQSCDDRDDFDSLDDGQTDGTANTSFATCGTDSADLTLAETMTTVRGSSVMVASAGTASLNTRLTRGTQITVGGLVYTVLSVSSSTTITVFPPAQQSQAGLTIDIHRGYKFPFE